MQCRLPDPARARPVGGQPPKRATDDSDRRQRAKQYLMMSNNETLPYIVYMQLPWVESWLEFVSRWTACKDNAKEPRNALQIARPTCPSTVEVHRVTRINKPHAALVSLWLTSVYVNIRPKAGREVEALNWTQEPNSVWDGLTSKAMRHAPRPARDLPVPK